MDFWAPIQVQVLKRICFLRIGRFNRWQLLVARLVMSMVQVDHICQEYLYVWQVEWGKRDQRMSDISSLHIAHRRNMQSMAKDSSD